jgi:hypothetical protein
MKNINFAKDIQVKDIVLQRHHLEGNRTILDNYINDYYTNNFHFRDTDDWESGKPSDIVALGCSHTYGIGVPQDYNWPSIVKLKTNKSLANLGICGASAASVLNSFLLYLDRVGVPKYVIGCFPDYLRYSHISDGRFYYFYKGQTVAQKVVTHVRTADYITGASHVEDKIIKLPTDPKYVISAEESLSQYISSIYTIEKVCKFLNIKFYWGTWSGFTQEMFEKNLFLEEEFCLDKNNYVKDIDIDISLDGNTEEISQARGLGCKSDHEMSKEDFEKYKDMWGVASDQNHLGIHWQHHTAENFIKKIGEIK